MSEEFTYEVRSPTEAGEAAISACAEVADACRDSVAKVLLDVAMAPLFWIQIRVIRREPVHCALRMRAKLLFDDSRSMGIELVPDNDEPAGDRVLKMA
jgi:hypothetical protein